MLSMNGTMRDNRIFIGLLLVFGLIRTAIADYNPIPSGSMHPTILEGDVVLVDRTAYDLKVPLTDRVIARLGEPKRSDIVTFYSPKDGARLIKRIVGLPGDIVEMRHKQLFINEKPASYVAASEFQETVAPGVNVPGVGLIELLDDHSHRIQWLSGVANASDFGPVAIPNEQFLMLGDNRDNSADSRYIGLVPRQALIGRAHHILVSAAIKDDWLPRLERFGQQLQ